MSSENLPNDELNHLPNVTSLPVRKPTIDEVDQLADELVAEFQNPEWREWYCLYINRYGTEQVRKWRDKARKGRVPARLFSTMLKQAQLHGTPEASGTDEPVPPGQQHPEKLDDIYFIADNPTQADVDKFVGRQIDIYLEGAAESHE